MNVTFGASEILLVGGICMIGIGQPIPGWIFVAAGAFGAFFNMALKMQEKKTQSENVQKFVDTLSSKINGSSGLRDLQKFMRNGNESVN